MCMNVNFISEMSLPQPMFSKFSFDNTRLTSFFSEWLAQTTQTMTDWRMIPKAVTQILQKRIDSFRDKIYVKLRYGITSCKSLSQLINFIICI